MHPRSLNSPRPILLNFVGLLLQTPAPFDCIPLPGHGHVILSKKDPAADQPVVNGELGVGPVLVYQIGTGEI
ncbi:Squalene epoxidase [Puccinia graminis f. sp. tritici]|uniref:Squalene epoxidase n=1 Tax=Puccinia graminis f. sp. tritici TaxID=56615 RepID=A0A5B0RT25_PUCGR|nr:Squalene epoxidase [Puccinia graminis f. sp. tritici]